MKLHSILRRFWLDLRLWIANHLVAHVPSHWLRLAYYRLVLKAKIGRGSSIFMGAWFDIPGGLLIGTNTSINQKCRLDSRGGLTIGNNVSISAEVCILTAKHDLQSAAFLGITEPVRIGDYVFVGTRAMILPGATLGEGSVVAAGAVVTRDVEPYTIVAGVPAKPIGRREKGLNYSAHYRRFFH